MYSLQDVMSRFADYLSKVSDGNIGKLMTIFSEQLQSVDATNVKIKEWRLIDNAQGLALDLIGENINQSRGVATDEIYRVLLKSKIARSLSTGDINTIIGVLSVALNVAPSEIKISEKYNDSTNPEPAAISVIRLPIDVLNKVGMTPQQVGRIVQRTVAAGINVNSISLEGTFEFGPIPIETSGTAGFSDTAGTTGGFFGTVYDPGKDTELPI